MDIGGKLYKYQGFGKIAEYECTAIIERKELRLFEVECKNCTHGSHCLLLVRPDDDGGYKFASMVNNEDQEPWHTSCTKHEKFFLTPEEAKVAVYTDTIRKCDEEINRLRQLILSQEKRKAELADHLKNINDTKK